MKGKDISEGRKNCTGCEACVNLCPRNAIKMQEDWRGFLFPNVDPSKCIDCGLCQKRCPSNKNKKEFIFPEAGAYVDGNQHYLKNASSGGAFGVIARHVLSKGGVVYGAAMDDNYRTNYMGIEAIGDLYKIQGSKYVQAHTGPIYKEVLKNLMNGRHVLFCGCPCQVAGLNSFLGQSFPNLITMDLICHGVPSQPYFIDYVNDLLHKQAKEGYTSFRFRCKTEDCNNNIHTPIKNKIYVGYSNKDYYMTYFLWGKGFRDSCYQCKYAGGARPGDFTIGDYNNKETHFLSSEDVDASLVLFNTQKSINLKHLFLEAGEYKEVSSLQKAIGKDGGQLSHPSKYDIRCHLVYLLWRLFGTSGPKLLYKFDKSRIK